MVAYAVMHRPSGVKARCISIRCVRDGVLVLPLDGRTRREDPNKPTTRQ